MLKKIGHVLLMVIIALTIGLGFYSWNAKTLLGTKVPMPLGHGAAVVLSGSMEPTLSIDDLIIIKKTDDYKVNDIIVYQANNIVVVHRVIGIEEGKFITKGDANNVSDEPVDSKNVIGEVIFVVPGVGQVVEAIRSPIGMITILSISFILLEMSYRKEREAGDQSIEQIKEEIRRLKEEQK